MGLRIRHIERKLISLDPRSRAILAHIRLIWRRLLPCGELFFDEKPIVVKAYGGRSMPLPSS